MNATFNSISASMRFILGLAGVLMAGVMFGSYAYTSNVTKDIKEEQRVWRDEHNQATRGSLEEIKAEQKEFKAEQKDFRKEINREFDRLEDRQRESYDKIGDTLQKILDQKRSTP